MASTQNEDGAFIVASGFVKLFGMWATTTSSMTREFVRHS